ncbi:4'-phosphopantetheinyl transferase family protein [Salana multivorans]|uniref:4'-phosphopantetheinyl transferase family protein n=1 Tax=Salana multivorans TaxID=120377 RepID=UPI000F4CC58F|nr:hypothetical protein [Salana multivorans]
MRWRGPGARAETARLSRLDAVRPRAYAALSEVERARLATLSDAAADEVLLGRWLLRSLAAEAVPGAEPQDVVVEATCPACGREHGRPTLPGLGLLGSIAHAGGLVVAAVARRDAWSAVGIDTEPVGAQGLGEAELLRWTEREAIGKALGVGIVEHVALDPAAGRPDDAARPDGWRLERLATPGHLTTLALR